MDFKKVKNSLSGFLDLCTTAIDVKGVTCEDARSGSTIIHITSNNQTNLQTARNKIETEGLKLNSKTYGNTVFIKRRIKLFVSPIPRLAVVWPTATVTATAT